MSNELGSMWSYFSTYHQQDTDVSDNTKYQEQIPVHVHQQGKPGPCPKPEILHQ